MLERVPIPVKEGVEEPAAKINVLLQAYISQLKLEGNVAHHILSPLINPITRLCSRRGHGVCAAVRRAVRPSRSCFPLSVILTPGASILRAMYEICLKRGWAVPTRAALDMCKMVEKRMCVSVPFTRLSPSIMSHLQVELDDAFTTI